MDNPYRKSAFLFKSLNQSGETQENDEENVIVEENENWKRKISFNCSTERSSSVAFSEIIDLTQSDDIAMSNRSFKSSFQESLSLSASCSNATLQSIEVKAGLRHNSVSSTDVDQVKPGSNSFDLFLNSLLNPPNKNFTVKNSQPVTQTSEDQSSKSFEEFMEKILTPDINIAQKKQDDFEKDSNKITETSQDLRHKGDELSFDEIITKMLAPRNLAEEKEKQREITKDSNKITETSQDLQHKGDEFSFDEIITKMLTPRNLAEEKEKQSQMSDDYSATYLQSSMQSVGGSAEKSFEDLIDKMLTPDPRNSNKETGRDPQKSCLKEMSTQTSFDELSSFNMSQRSDLPVTSIAHRYAPFSYQKNFATFEETTVENNAETKIPSEDASQEQASVVEKINILDVLSQDICISQDGSKTFHNISKIGTLKWLQSALATVDKLGVNKNRRAVVEIHNYYDLHIEDDMKSRVRNYRKGKIRIFKIDKFGSRRITRFQRSVTHSFSEDDEDACVELTGAEEKLRSAIAKICADKDLVAGDDSSRRECDKSKIKSAIHDLFARLYEVFHNDQMPCFVFKWPRDPKHCVMFKGRLHLKQNGKPEGRVNFALRRSRYKMCYMLYLLGKVYTLLENNNKLTRREIYYQMKPLVKSQAVINIAIDEVSRFLTVGQWHLNIVSHCGQIYGNLKLFWASGEITDCNAPATMIPYNIEDIVEMQSTACFILVIEKESMFHKLLEEDLPNKLARPFIMITGKGVPDLNTRLFLNKISNMMSLPVFILVDADIYGIKIMLTYRFGSAKSCHVADQLAVPNARWLGVFPSEISKYGMQHQKLSNRDKRLTKLLLECPFMEDQTKISRELNVLLESNKKASIEGLIKNNTFLSESYLPMKFFNQDFL